MKVASFNSASALGGAIVLATSPAYAQTAAPQQPAAAEQETGGLQDIVVTAQKRSESAQQVPIAISAVTPEALQAKGLTDVASISGQAPNVTLQSPGAFGGSCLTPFTYISVTGQKDFSFQFVPDLGAYACGRASRREGGCQAG